jgi:hypothetical protein
MTLWLFGDIHRDTKNCDVDRWKWFLKRAKETMDENTYFIGMGDYHDFASTKEKKFLDGTGIHETTRDRFDEMAERHNRELAAELSFMRGRILGLVVGNHSWVFKNGKTSTEDLAERLDTKDLGWLCHYTMIIRTGGHKTNNAVHAILCHGKAGGKTFGVTVNQVGDLKTIFPVADFYCMGHDHQRIAHPCTVLVPCQCKDSYQIKQKRQLLCRSGSFLKAYQEGTDSYEIFRLYKPADLGALKLTINFHRDLKGGIDRIITDISAEI